MVNNRSCSWRLRGHPLGELVEGDLTIRGFINLSDESFLGSVSRKTFVSRNVFGELGGGDEPLVVFVQLIKSSLEGSLLSWSKWCWVPSLTARFGSREGWVWNTWWETNSVRLNLVLELEGHQRWTKSWDNFGNNVWSKLPHTNDGWESRDKDDWSNEQISNGSVADVGAPGWFATDGVSLSLVSTSWDFGVGVVVVHFLFIFKNKL